MRLLTRPDFDGLACAVVLKDIGVVDSWLFVQPEDLQGGAAAVTRNDLLANVPYDAGCGMWFDHHTGEPGNGAGADAMGLTLRLDSAARVVWQYYRGAYDLAKYDPMLAAVDKINSAKLTAREILNPEGWMLLGFIIDPCTGTDRFQGYRISGRQLIETLVDACAKLSINDILALPDVKERVDLYNRHRGPFAEMLKERSSAHQNVLVTDLRGAGTIYAGNRFIVYSLFPEQNVSIWAEDSGEGQSCAIGVGYSVINRTNQNDVGAILREYGGGGHRQVGACTVPAEDADRVVAELCMKLQ